MRIEYPFDWNLPDELLDYRGYFETTNNCMELEPCIFVHEWILETGFGLGANHFQIVTDSKYVYENYARSIRWSQNQWRSLYGRPLDNIDQWKVLLRLRRKIGYRVRVEIKLIEGKSTPITKAVDLDAKSSSLLPSHVDRGFKSGKIGRSKNNPGRAAKMFPASGQELTIRVYQTVSVRRDEQKIKFQVYSAQKKGFFEKFTAYADPNVGNDLHRQQAYIVRMNDVPQYPKILKIIAGVREAL